MISHSKAHFLLGTNCASFLSHNFEYKIVCHCIEEHPSKIRKKIATTSMLSLSTRLTRIKQNFLYSERAKKSGNKKTTK